MQKILLTILSCIFVKELPVNVILEIHQLH